MKIKMGAKRMKRLMKRVDIKSLIGRDIEIGGSFPGIPTLEHSKCKIIDCYNKWCEIKVYHLSNETRDFLFHIPYEEICYIYPNFINENHLIHYKKTIKLKNLRRNLIRINEQISYLKKQKEYYIKESYNIAK